VKQRVESHRQSLKEEAASTAQLIVETKKRSRTALLISSAVLAAAIVAGCYLFISRAAIENKYEQLLAVKEAEFAEKTKFENRSPIAPEELDATVWEVEALPVGGDKASTIFDKIRFENGRITSEYFSSRGFKTSNYSVTHQQNGLVIWETIQTASNGDTLSWRGDWQGEAMKGVASFAPANGKAQDFSFFSSKWSYEK
jgi:hypothetical protein